MARDVCLVNVNLIRCLEHVMSPMERVIVRMATMAPFVIKVRINNSMIYFYNGLIRLKGSLLTVLKNVVGRIYDDDIGYLLLIAH